MTGRCVITSIIVLFDMCKLLIPPVGFLQPLDVPPYAWHIVITDYNSAVPLAPQGNNAIAVFVDELTKHVHVV